MIPVPDAGPYLLAYVPEGEPTVTTRRPMRVDGRDGTLHRTQLRCQVRVAGSPQTAFALLGAVVDAVLAQARAAGGPPDEVADALLAAVALGCRGAGLVPPPWLLPAVPPGAALRCTWAWEGDEDPA
jgi:hypothetical protein